MPRVMSINYVLDSGAGVSYVIDKPQEVDEETMSAIIKLVDGMDVQDLIEELL